MPKPNQPPPPEQAVILAGGLGTRLRPLTNDLAKPMLRFHGRPFLEYLIDMLRDQGIRRVLLLLGYRAETVQNYFGDGGRFGIAIDYSVTPAEDETGRRMKAACSRLDDRFLFFYCDNIWPLDLNRLWRAYLDAGRPAQITVYRNRDGYTRDNVAVGADGKIGVYDKTRTAPDLGGVDIGFAILPRTAVAGLPDENVSFEATVFPALAARGELGAFETDHRYYSIGSLDRLPATERFLAREPAVLLDRDGVLNRRMRRADYVTRWNEWAWCPGALEALRELHNRKVRTFVVTNQPGLARGRLTPLDLASIHGRMRDAARAAGGGIAAVYHCPHGWDEGCDCRKPAPGLLYRAQRDFALDLGRVPFAGDDERDAGAAAAAGCPFYRVTDETPLAALVPEILNRLAA